MNALLLIALPYASIAIFIAGMIWRYRSPASISSRSSQILERRWLLIGAAPFHLGILTLFFGHLIPLLVPGWWRELVSNRTALLTIETIGAAAALLCIIGLAALLVRRIASRAVFATSTVADVIVLVILLAQAASGLAVATLHRWGSVWSIGTTTPYLRGILTFQPEPQFVAGVPPLMMMHLAGAWIVLAVIPFTRLVHLFSLPLGYLRRPPQRVAWTR